MIVPYSSLWCLLVLYLQHRSCSILSGSLYTVLFSLWKGDVYPVEPYDDFSANQVLDAHWGILYDEDVRCLCLWTYGLFSMSIHVLHYLMCVIHWYSQVASGHTLYLCS